MLWVHNYSNFQHFNISILWTQTGIIYLFTQLYTIHLIINDQYYLNETTGITTKVIMESSHDLFDWQVTISMIINYRCLKINSNINHSIKKLFTLKKQQQKFSKHINNILKNYTLKLVSIMMMDIHLNHWFHHINKPCWHN